jgi:hypothetical protein
LGVGLYCPYHQLEILGKLLFIFIGSNRGKQLRFIFFKSPFETLDSFFHCTHGGEKMMSHDVVWDAIASIANDVGFHVANEQTHIFSQPTL